MGGAADLPNRSSSPLKRRAEELETEVDAQSGQKDDIDMLVVSDFDDAEATESSARPTHQRSRSVDMLRGEQEATSSIAQADASVSSPRSEIPSIDAQIKTITTLCEAALQEQLHEGDKVYLVSKRWLERVISRGSEARQKSKVEPEGEIGLVDNSDIIQRFFTDYNGQEFVQLKDGVGQESAMLLPKDAWDMVVEWYGLIPGHVPIIRIAHNTNPDKSGLPNMIYELHPPIFVVHRLWSVSANHLVTQQTKAMQPDAPVFVFSRSERYVDFLKQIKVAAQVDATRKIRIWRVPRSQPAAESTVPVANTVTPPASRPTSESGSPGPGTSQNVQDTWNKLLLDVATFADIPKGSGRELVEIDDHSVNTNYNGKSDIAFCGLGDSQTIVIDECVEGKDYVLTYTPKTGKTANTITRSTGLNPTTSGQTNSGRNSPSPSGPVTRGRAQRHGRTRGTVGLSNLGNTCYMNSALQCVRSVEELTKYFLSGAADGEINTNNPLGNNGEVAGAYGALLRDIYITSQSSVAPRGFKNTIGRYAPSFSGYGQQDSQEFLGFLLDGLQEDLSRVAKKPYIEKPDSTDEMVNNPDAIREMAAKVWDITKKRDDSVIADLFTGMYKSTLVCPVCAKVSITFDPFNNLTLQLPIENSWSHGIIYFPMNDKPIRILVDIDKQSSILGMKRYLSSRVGVPVERLFVAEEFKAKFYKVHEDGEVASEVISPNDVIAIYELERKPTNWPSPNKAGKKKGSSTPTSGLPNWDSPLAENLLVPVFYRRPYLERRGYGSKKPWQISAAPHVIVITAEEARSEEMIRKKVLEKVTTFTTYPDLFEDDEASESLGESLEGGDADLVHANGSDSSGDKIVASSVDGEDGLVDVTMKGSHEAPSETALESEHSKSQLPTFNKRRPKFMQRGAFLDPRLQNMFDLCYFTTSESMPQGWNAADDDKTFPSISSRNPQRRQVEQDDEDLDMTTGRASSESSNEDDTFGDNHTRMNDESSDEDELALSAPRALPVRPAGPRNGVRVGQVRRSNRMKTYSRKGTRSVRKLSNTSDFEQDAPDDGPLIRLGEGIVVDWTTEAYESLFEGSAGDTMRGRSTWDEAENWEDPEIQVKQKARREKKKHGIKLDDCLDEFGKEEVLSEQDTWYCPRCKEHRRATKKFELWKTSDILVMHLKRFSSSGWRRDKLEVLVDFPIEGLDLTSRVIETEDGKSEVYDLFAVDDHWGGLGGGHYTAFAKNFNDDKWYEYNDSSVSEVKDLRRIVSPAAYLLFYRRRSDSALGGPKVQEAVNKYDKPQSSEDEEPDSGEGPGLGANLTSLRGSPSALTGVGAAHHQASGSGQTGQMTTINPQDLDQSLPAYQAHEDNNDAAPLLERDALMNDGLGLHNSIEDDEGIGMGYNNLNLAKFTPINQSTYNGTSDFNFDNLPSNSLNGLGSLAGPNRSNYISGATSEVDMNHSDGGFPGTDGSDIVQNNSSASPGSRRGHIDDFDNADAINEDGEPFEDPSPVPDIDDDQQLEILEMHRELMSSHARSQSKVQLGQDPPPSFQVNPPEDEELDNPATEIHIEDADELKME